MKIYFLTAGQRKNLVCTQNTQGKVPRGECYLETENATEMTSMAEVC